MFERIVVFPCYNEARRLEASAFVSFLKQNRDTAFLFVNDGSTDSTGEILDRITREAPGQSVAILVLSGNSGKAEAVRRGMLEAMRLHPEAKVIGFMDSDLSAPPEEALRLTEKILSGEKEFVFGARVALCGLRIVRNPLRHYGGRIFATLASLTLGMSIYDTQCGAKFFRNSFVLEELFGSPFLTGWCFDVELIARMKNRIVRENRQLEDILLEMPLNRWEHKSGSKVSVLDFFRSLYELYRIRTKVLNR